MSHAERQIALSLSKQNRLCPDPGQSAVASLARADIAGIPFPLALPMDKHIDVVAFNQNALDGKLQLEYRERCQNRCMDIPLHLVQAPDGNSNASRRSVPLHVGFPE